MLKCERCNAEEAKVACNGKNICLTCYEFLCELLQIVEALGQDVSQKNRTMRCDVYDMPCERVSDFLDRYPSCDLKCDTCEQAQKGGED